ncbi:sigma-70 family RNA polymerase sigma factor [Botrimarina sp.]|uniref:sigma-70 family RNA polymerase sigma factor n=1 Tax=Botrimarina sp. TaxID=2795802 RepID=UPI0032EB17D8
MGDLTRITLLDRVQQAQSGEPWEEFVRVYDGLIASWLRSQRINDADADDIRQEVMQAVVRDIPRFQHSGRPGAFRAWLRRITANRMRRLWQQRSRSRAEWGGLDVSEIADLLEDDSSRLTLAWDRDHDKFVLNRMLGMLHGRFSQQSLTAFRRLAIAQEPVDVVSRDLGMTIGAARVAQHRVLRALKTLGEGLVDI